YLAARHPVRTGIETHRAMAGGRLEEVEQLPLVFLDALDVHIKQSGRVYMQPEPFPNDARQGQLVGALDGRDTLLQPFIVSLVAETVENRWVVEDAGAACLAQHPRQPRIGLVQPAAERDAVGLVDDAVRIEPVTLGKSAAGHQL